MSESPIVRKAVKARRVVLQRELQRQLKKLYAPLNGGFLDATELASHIRFDGAQRGLSAEAIAERCKLLGLTEGARTSAKDLRNRHDALLAAGRAHIDSLANAAMKLKSKAEVLKQMPELAPEVILRLT